MNSWTKRHNTGPNGEQGIALIVALFALLLLSAIAMGMMYMADTESSVNNNYRDDQVAFFGARAGLEEARTRLMLDAASPPPPVAQQVTPAQMPAATGGVIYITNPRAGENVDPGNAANTWYDDELCKEQYVIGGAMLPGATGVPCARASLPPGVAWYSRIASTMGGGGALNYKWVRITLKQNRSSSPYPADGNSATVQPLTQVCWTGAAQALLPAGNANCRAAGMANVYVANSLAVTQTGARRMTAMELVPYVTVPVQAAIYSRLSSDTGQALNVTGNKEPHCSDPSTYGVESGTSTVTTPGGGNVSGSPAATRNNAGWPYDIPGIFASLQPDSSPIDIAGTGVIRNAGPPVTYTGANATLGTVPTVNPSSGPISTITTPGTPKIFYSPNATTLGTQAAGTGVNGYGVLMVNGNLTIDVSNGFDFYGLIVANGDVTFTARNGTAVNPQIHGTIILNGKFTAPISNMGGAISVYQDSCFVNSGLGTHALRIVAYRESMY